MSSTYYDTSYPPSLWTEPPVIEAETATAGTPGSWGPAGCEVPANVAAVNGITAIPATTWTVGQYVQTMTFGAAGQCHWNGTAWVAGAAPAVGGETATQEAPQAPVVPQEATDSPQGTETAQEPPEAPQAP